MTSTPESPQQGWYPDPQVPNQMRFWNGSEWTQEHFPVQRPDKPLGYRFALLGHGVRAGLILSVLVGIGEVALFSWGLSMFDEAVATGDIDRLSRYDDLHAVLGTTEVVLFVATGILWLIWQFLLARSVAPGELDRSPGWHIGSWFIPFANLVMPFQNVRDLWRTFVSTDGTALVGWWWTTTLATTVLLRIGVASDTDSGLNSLETQVSWSLASSVVGIVSAVLAVLIIRRLTVGGLVRSAAGGRPGPS